MLCLAYIDPGTGSILLQVLIGSVVGTGLFFWHSLARFFGVFRRGPKPGDPNTTSTAEESAGD